MGQFSKDQLESHVKACSERDDRNRASVLLPSNLNVSYHLGSPGSRNRASVLHTQSTVQMNQGLTITIGQLIAASDLSDLSKIVYEIDVDHKERHYSIRHSLDEFISLQRQL